MLVLHNRAMQSVGFNEHEPVIVASGVFSMSSMSPANLEKTITYSGDILGNKVLPLLLSQFLNHPRSEITSHISCSDDVESCSMLLRSSQRRCF